MYLCVAGELTYVPGFWSVKGLTSTVLMLMSDCIRLDFVCVRRIEEGEKQLCEEVQCLCVNV